MCSCRWHLDQHTSYVRCLLHPLHSSLSTQSPLCSFKDDPPFHTDLLADRHWWIDRPTLLIGFLLLFFFFLFTPLCSNTQTHKQTQIPAAPIMPVTFLISSELLSMPAVKRFSVSYARHPTNGMSAFFFRHSSSSPLILHDGFVGKHFLCFLFWEVWRVATLLASSQIFRFFLFLFQRTPSVFGFCFVFTYVVSPSPLTSPALPASVFISNPAVHRMVSYVEYIVFLRYISTGR